MAIKKGTREMNANELADELEKITTYKEAEHDIFSDKEKLKEAATMLRQQQAEIEALRNRNWDLVSEPWGFDRHSYKPSKSEVDALLDNADYVVGIMREEIEEWKRKYKDMHNLATQAMSKVHQLEKEASEK